MRPDPLKDPKYLDIDGGTFNGRDHNTYTSKQPYSGTQWQVYGPELNTRDFGRPVIIMMLFILKIWHARDFYALVIQKIVLVKVTK